MSQLVVLSFDGADQAKQALASLRAVEREGRLAFNDTAVLSKDAGGKVHVHNEASSATEVGAVGGAVLGPLLMFMFPIAGIAIGAGAGALIGKLVDQGVDGKFVDEVKESLQPNSSALFLVVDHGEPAAVRAALQGYHGQVLQTTLDPEMEEGLRRVLQ